jgi:hypothetical protein
MPSSGGALAVSALDEAKVCFSYSTDEVVVL